MNDHFVSGRLIVQRLSTAILSLVLSVNNPIAGSGGELDSVVRNARRFIGLGDDQSEPVDPGL